MTSVCRPDRVMGFDTCRACIDRWLHPLITLPFTQEPWRTIILPDLEDETGLMMLLNQSTTHTPMPIPPWFKGDGPRIIIFPQLSILSLPIMPCSNNTTRTTSQKHANMTPLMLEAQGKNSRTPCCDKPRAVSTPNGIEWIVENVTPA